MRMCRCNQDMAGLDSRSLLNLDASKVRYLTGYPQDIDDHNSDTLATIIQHDTPGKQLVMHMRCGKGLKPTNHWQSQLWSDIAGHRACHQRLLATRVTLLGAMSAHRNCQQNNSQGNESIHINYYLHELRRPETAYYFSNATLTSRIPTQTSSFDVILMRMASHRSGAAG